MVKQITKEIKYHNKHGITLVALVITVIVLLIISGTVISISTNSESLLSKTNDAVEMFNQKASTEEQEMINYLAILKIADFIDKDTSGANKPVVPESNDKLEVYYLTWSHSEYVESDTYTEIPSTSEPQNGWYNYDEGKWANIKTVNKETGNEAYWVWIPRYAYKVPTRPTNSNYSKNPTFEIVFLKGTSNIPVDENALGENETIKDVYPNGGENDYVEEGEWVVHPAFNFGGTPLEGIWVGKFEASSTMPSAQYGGGNNASLYVNVMPTQISWRNISISNAFSVCKDMTQTGGTLAGTTTLPHLAKNVEWGAVAYITQSKYGEMRTGGNGQVWINPYRSGSSTSNYVFMTGMAGRGANIGNTEETDEYNCKNGPKASTTGNVYGVYDMAGGIWEYTAAYIDVETANTHLTALKNCLNGEDDAKYVDVYQTGETDSAIYHYQAIAQDEKITKWGDAVYETSKSYQGYNGLQIDYSYYPYGSRPVFNRSGAATYGVGTGVFAFGPFTGEPNSTIGFRPVFIVNNS
ncbi:MAG: hypothetical protein IKP28_01305 [Clostridia bacterium]|nr:hypothetical protein [Clostridia bacterium]